MQAVAIRLVAYVLVAVLALATGWSVRGWKEDSDDLSQRDADEEKRELIREAVAAIAETTGTAIAGIEVKNTTIYQRTRQEIIREPIDPACRLPAGWMRNINEARAGEAGPAADAEVSGHGGRAGQ